MKSYFLGIVCACIAIIGMVEKAQADDKIIISANSPKRSSQVNNRQATVIPNSAMDSLELSVYKQVNQYRQSKNLPPLTIDPAISAQAKRHSENMARTGNMSHDGFHERAESVAQTKMLPTIWAMPDPMPKQSKAGSKVPDTIAICWVGSI
jgi:hypothetical protein